MLAEERVWTELLLIIQEFEKSFTLSRDRKGQERLWEIVINIRENMLAELAEAMRFNLKLAYLLEEIESLKDLNLPFYKLNHIFEQDFYRLELDPQQGLNKFYKLVLATYGNIDYFIHDLRESKENLYFVRKNYGQSLIEKYRYLKNISLPNRGYENLRIRLTSLLSKFKELKKIITQPLFYQSILQESEEFISTYQLIYLQAHQSLRKKLKLFYAQLHSLPEYQLLEKFSAIKSIKVAYNLKPIKKYVDTFFPQTCSVHNLQEIIQQETKCPCGFTLGDILTIPDINKILPMLRQGIQEYLIQLQSKRVQMLFQRYLKFHPDSRLKLLCSLERKGLEDLLNLIDASMLKEINSALSSFYPLKISLDELAATMAGSYPGREIDSLGRELEKKISQLISDKIKNLEELGIDDVVINIIK